jgi:tetratricopeptide (TPR) repeat protein
MASRRTRKLGRRLVLLNDLLAGADGAPNLQTREQFAAALMEKAATLEKLGSRAAARAVCDDLERRFGGAPELPIREKVIKALKLKARSLGRVESALSIYDDLLARFGAATEESLREEVASAMLEKGITLEELGRPQASIVVYDCLKERFGGTASFTLETLVYAATYLGDVLKHGGRDQVWLKRIAEWTELIASHDAATDPAPDEQIAKALCSKAEALLELGRVEDAIECYDDLLVRFGDSSERPLRAFVNLAMLGKEFALKPLRSG